MSVSQEFLLEKLKDSFKFESKVELYIETDLSIILKFRRKIFPSDLKIIYRFEHVSNFNMQFTFDAIEKNLIHVYIEFER